EQRLDTYRQFWTEFGAVLKEGLVSYEDGHEQILDLVLAPSTEAREPTSLAEYVGRMKEGQPAVYYATAASREAAARSPHLEAFRPRGYEVLFFIDPIDELWLRLPRETAGKPLTSVSKGDIALGTEEEKKQAETAREETDERFKDFLLAMRARLQDIVKDVR